MKKSSASALPLAGFLEAMARQLYDPPQPYPPRFDENAPGAARLHDTFVAMKRHQGEANRALEAVVAAGIMGQDEHTTMTSAQTRQALNSAKRHFVEATKGARKLHRVMPSSVPTAQAAAAEPQCDRPWGTETPLSPRTPGRPATRHARK